MSHLPLEILKHIFDDIKKKEDLVQCQRTCKRWYKASVLHLYTIIELHSEERSRQYARTISNSPQLGSYLKIIDTKNLFTKVKYSGDNRFPNYVYNASNICFGDFDNFDNPPFNDMFGSEYRTSNRGYIKEYILDVIIRQCPNVTRIKLKRPPTIFWEKLSEAAVLGRLSQLSKLEDPTDHNSGPYIRTALSFKRSLQCLHIYEGGFYRSGGIRHSAGQMMLRQHIGEFTKLRRINILLLSDLQLNHLDELIEDCPHLEEISVRIDFSFFKMTKVQPDILVNARPDIHKFKSENIIATKNTGQLKYMMEKFTNLQHLVINFDLNSAEDYGRYNYTSDTLAQFLGYLMPIHICKVMLTVKERMFFDAWNQFTSRTDQSKKLILNYFGDINGNSTRIEIEQDFIKVNLAIRNGSNAFPHVEFLLRSGGRIRSLTLQDVWDKYMYEFAEPSIQNAIGHFDFLLDIFRLCPSLQKLTLLRPKDMALTGDLVYQHTELKTLHVIELKPDQPYEFLRHISFCLPKLKELYLQYNNNCIEDKPTIIIVDIQHTSLDVFIWEYLFFDYKCMGTLPFSIQLKTKKGIQFYVFSNECIIEFDEKEFKDLIPYHLHVEIVCESLKEFRLVTPPFSHMF